MVMASYFGCLEFIILQVNFWSERLSYLKFNFFSGQTLLVDATTVANLRAISVFDATYYICTLLHM